MEEILNQVRCMLKAYLETPHAQREKLSWWETKTMPNNWHNLRQDIGRGVTKDHALKLIRDQQYQDAWLLRASFLDMVQYGNLPDRDAIRGHFWAGAEWCNFVTYLVTKVSSLALKDGKLRYRSRSSVSNYVPLTKAVINWAHKCRVMNFGGSKTADMIKNIMPDCEVRDSWIKIAQCDGVYETFNPYHELESFIKDEQLGTLNETYSTECVVFRKGEHEAMFTSLNQFSTGWCIGSSPDWAKKLLEVEPMVIVRDKTTRTPKLAICTQDRRGEVAIINNKHYYVHGIASGQKVHEDHRGLVEYGLETAVKVFEQL